MSHHLKGGSIWGRDVDVRDFGVQPFAPQFLSKIDSEKVGD